MNFLPKPFIAKVILGNVSLPQIGNSRQLKTEMARNTKTGQPVPKQRRTEDTNVGEGAPTPKKERDTSPPVPASHGTPPVPASRGTPPVPASRGTPPVPASRGTPPARASNKLQPAPAIAKGIQNSLHLFDGIAKLASKVPDVDLNEQSLRKILAKITNADHIAELARLCPAPSDGDPDKLQEAWTKVVTYVLCAPYCKTTTLAKLAAAFPVRERTSLNSALEGTFIFVDTLKAMDASIGNDPMLRLTSLVTEKVKGYFRKPWIMSYGTEGTLTNRHVKVDCVATLFTMDDLSEDSALSIVSGESGAGKTNGVLVALPDGCIGLYATPTDFGDTWQESRWTDGKLQDVRDKAALKVVEHLLNKLIPADVADIVRNATCGKPTAFYLAIDEVGSYQQLLRALCSINQKPIDHLGVPVKMIAIGTGTDTTVAAPGSHPDLYHLFRVEAKGGLWSHIIKHAVPTNLSDEFLRKINEDDVGARALGGNARVAALMKEVACELPASSLLIANKSRRARDALCVTFFANVATTFRLKNSMSGCTEEMVQSVFSECARVVLFLQRGDVLEKSEAAVTMLQGVAERLVRMYGLLTDDARRILTADKIPEGFKEYPCSRDDTSYLVAPFDEKRGVFKRFRMSPAQLALFRQQYGYAASFRCDGDGFGEACLQFLEFALLGANGRTVLELLRLLNGGHAVGVGALGNVVLQYSAVRVLQSSERVYPGMAFVEDDEPGMTVHPGTMAKASVLDYVKDFVKEGAAVVLRNAINADFADVLVFLPDVGVILVQNKFVQDFDEATQSNEVAPLYAKLREVVQGDIATPFIKLCLMTSQARRPDLPEGTLQFHATEETMTPVVFSNAEQASTSYTELGCL